ncbi:MAG TPA: helix-turn-helix domain-containing protein [Polyangiales bacterium]|nr:helix-turn-helix domain-containing protein [Polyangiales bacterium]
MAKKRASTSAIKLMERLTGGPLTFGKMLQAVREGDELTLEAFAKRLGVSRQNLCDIEKGRKGVSPERAARWARLLGYSEAQWLRLALQAELDAAGLKYRVEIQAA